MKLSIRFKLLAWILGVMIVVISAGALVGTSFIEGFYMNSKKAALKTAYNEMVSMIDENGIFLYDDNTMDTYCENKGITMIVLNGDMHSIYDYGPSDILLRRIEQIIFEHIIRSQGVNEEILESNENYTLKMVTDLTDSKNTSHMEMSGVVGDSQYFVMRIAVQNVRESIMVANKFYGMLGVILMLVVSVAMLIVTRRFTKPILRLSQISKEMSDMNFDVHYEDDRNDEIGVLGESINEMSQKLKTAISELKTANIELEKDIKKKNEIDKMRTEFLSNVSHELKTPIALVQGYAEGLRDGITDDPESMEFYCDVIIDEANKMNKMVKNLLLLNQIEFGDTGFEMERFNLTELVRGVINSHSINAGQKGVTMEFDCQDDVYVWGDEFQIEQVITNYVSNAFNHVKENNIIKVQIVENDGIVRMSVFNTGDNIPDEDIEHIWEKFYKVDKARTREYGGNGIGLSIVKAIIEGMGKECGVINHVDGVEFWFELEKA